MRSFGFLLLTLSLCGAAAYSAAEDKKDAVEKPNQETAAVTNAQGADQVSPADSAKSKPPAEKNPEKVDWKKVDWRKRLTKLQYHITREAGTERPFKNEYWNHFEDGTYKCVGCGLPLFESDSKFDAHCGWPSFDRTIAKDTVKKQVDFKLGYPRTEIRCRRCDAHLGHVFEDGPTETGQRYCMNSAAMKFVSTKPAKKSEIAKRGAADETKQAPNKATDKEPDSKAGDQPSATAESADPQAAK